MHAQRGGTCWRVSATVIAWLTCQLSVRSYQHATITSMTSPHMMPTMSVNHMDADRSAKRQSVRNDTDESRTSLCQM
ncbi:hypothetical protein EDC04DRAFT_2676732 [Pisolithus marmoratus]|nr:hypothetical protein EDC04DRAFT_2676732 [Pisolithus marmoratus]